MQSRVLYGRTRIMSDVTEVNDGNIVDVLEKAMVDHVKNREEIDYLWDYYRGKQPILNRQKKVRPEICNRIVENRANEIVSFKVGYLLGEPIQYISNSGGEKIANAVSYLNSLMMSEKKAAQDKTIGEWQMIGGTAYRLVLPNVGREDGEAPFEMFSLDPRDTFVVYSNEIGNKPLIGVKYCTDEFGIKTYSVYSDHKFWKIRDGKILDNRGHILGMVPIIEYPANNALQGAFEIVLSLLDAINTLASNRMDGIEQFVQAFIKFINCDIDGTQFRELIDLGGIKVSSTDGNRADVDIVSKELNQMQTQTLVDYMYQTVLTVCGIPNRNGGSSTSDTGSAVMLRDGWSLAEARAKDSELMFKCSERNVLKLVLKICRETDGLPEELYDLKQADIKIKFTRRNYEAILSKSQVLVSMLQQEKIHPRLAFEYSGMFIDPEGAYTMSNQYYENQKMIGGEETADDDMGVNPPNAGSDKTEKQKIQSGKTIIVGGK